MSKVDMVKEAFEHLSKGLRFAQIYDSARPPILELPSLAYSRVWDAIEPRPMGNPPTEFMYAGILIRDGRR